MVNFKMVLNYLEGDNYFVYSIWFNIYDVNYFYVN